MSNTYFVFLKAETDLPSYFKIRAKQPSTKETALNQKIRILSEKIKNYLDDEKRENIKNYSQYSKKIYLTKKKELFWDRLIKASE